MILRSDRGRLQIVTQTDHAHLSGEFASAWGGQRFRTPDPVTPVRLAADLHDHGWLEWERAPMIDATSGRPYDFLSLPTDIHVDLYGKGIQLALQEHPYAGLLVSLHGTGLYKERYGYLPEMLFGEIDPAHRPLVDQFLAEQEALQKGLLADLRIDPQVLWTHYRWLQAWDLLSLFLCLSDPAERHVLSLGMMPHYPGGPEERLEVRGAGSGRFCVSPWPFSVDALELSVPVRHITDRSYESDAQFQTAFQAAPTERLALTLAPCD